MAHPSSRKVASSIKQQNEATLKPNDSNACQVRVCVRVRPITAKEQENGASSALDVSNTNAIQLSGRRFTFDSVFDETTAQTDLYHQIAPSLMQSFLDGYNATVRNNLQSNAIIYLIFIISQ
jgi:Kinesin motor domain